eukprot:g776.t1
MYDDDDGGGDDDDGAAAEGDEAGGLSKGTSALVAVGEKGLMDIIEEAVRGLERDIDQPNGADKHIATIKAAVDMILKWYGEDDARYPDAMMQLAKANADGGNVMEATELAQRAFELYSALYGKKSPEYAKVEEEWGWLLTLMDDDDNPLGSALGGLAGALVPDEDDADEDDV